MDIGRRRRLLLERRFVGHRQLAITFLKYFGHRYARIALHYIGVGRTHNDERYYVLVQAPHPPLKDYYAREADRGGWVRGLFDRTAADYDRVERAMAFGTGSWYRRRALARA